MIRRCSVILALLMVSGVTPAIAQLPASAPDPANVRIRFGPLWINPSASLTNLGVDDNVFNDPDAAAPKQDFTMTFTPMTDLWLRFGPTWIKGTIREDIIWYQKYASERSGNTTYSVSWQVPLNRLAFTASNTWVMTRERPGFEIDARAQRKETTSSGSAEIRALSKTFIGVRAERSAVDYDKDAVFLGNNLSNELSRVATTEGVTLRHRLTPLTSLTFAASRSQERFAVSPLRDSDSTSFDTSVIFDPAALIKGSARFGYRDFRPSASDVPGYKGTTASVSLSYSFLGSTKLTLGVLRDVQYSFDVRQPYYLLTSFDGSVAQQLFGPLDVVARAGLQHLNYQDRTGAAVAVANRVDIVHSIGGGIGYHLGRDIRVGFNLDQQRRQSEVTQRQYNGSRIGMSVSYGT